MKLFTLLLALTAFFIEPAYAGPNYAAVKREAENIKKAERKLAKKIAKLSAADRQRLKSKFSGTDSDADGVADIIEGALGINQCDSDSDDDGFEDSEDFREDIPGSDDDTPEYEDGDNNSPDRGDDSPGADGGAPNPGSTPPPGDTALEFEVKGRIARFEDPVLVIRGLSYTLKASTQFVGMGFGKEDLDEGVCVEVKGVESPSERSLTRIKRDNDCR